MSSCQWKLASAITSKKHELACVCYNPYGKSTRAKTKMGKLKRCTFHVDGSRASTLNKRLGALLKNMPGSTSEIRFADLFCGIGSFHAALRDAGCICTYACDISKHAQDFYSANFQLSPGGDITQTEPSDLPDFDILCAGFPCQSFSVMGKRKGLEDEKTGGMFDHLMRFVRVKNPYVVILENVEGILSADEGRVMEYIQKSLREALYSVTHRVLRCNEFGIPQKRCRVFIIGILDGVRVSKPVSELLDVDRFKEEITLAQFLRVPVIKKYANTIRIGGRANTYSSKNWNQYMMADGEPYQLSLEDGIRLQGFEGHTFEDSESQVWRLLGNTIPTVLSRLVVYSVLSNISIPDRRALAALGQARSPDQGTEEPNDKDKDKEEEKEEKETKLGKNIKRGKQVENKEAKTSYWQHFDGVYLEYLLNRTVWSQRYLTKVRRAGKVRMNPATHKPTHMPTCVRV